MNAHDLSTDIPLGSFEGVLLRVFPSGPGSPLHTARECSELGHHETEACRVPLTSTVLGKLCLHCSAVPGGSPVTAVGLFTEAVLTVLRAAALFEDEKDSWDAQSKDEGPWGEADKRSLAEEEHEALRETAEETWLASTFLLRSLLDAVARYPMLEPWAQLTITTVTTAVEYRRQAFANLVASRDLLETAAAFLVVPELPVDRPEFETLEAKRVQNTLDQLRNSWQREVQHHPHGFSSDSLVNVLRRRVPDDVGEDARSAFREVVEGWYQEAQNTVSRFTSSAKRWVLLTLPHRWHHSTDWWTATVATYSMASDWHRQALLLRAPELIVRRLAEEAEEHGIACEELTRAPDADGATLLSELLRSSSSEPTHVLVPGLLDDVPVHERRLLSVEDAVYLSGSYLLSQHPYIVFSATHGTEVMYPAALEKRCRDGWEGVLLAGARDLPTTLVAPLVKRALAHHEARTREPLHVRNRVHADDVLGQPAGETSLGLWDDSLDMEARLLVLARASSDLRDFVEETRRSAGVPNSAHALLSLHSLDLDPFRPLGKPLFDRGGPNWRDAGLGLPLAHLASIQIYSTDMRQDLSKMGHAPGCQHSPSHFGHEFSLMTVDELMTIFPGRWCSTCGGYAVRRLDEGQLTYYHLAHELHRLWSAVNRWADRLSRLSQDDVLRSLTKLDELASGPFDPRMDRAARERWKGAIREIRIRAERVLRFLRKPDRSARARLSRALRQMPETPEEMSSVDVRLEPILGRDLKVILGRANRPELRLRISTVLDHLNTRGNPPPGGFPLLTLLEQARAHASESGEWQVVSLLQDCLDFAENRLSKPDFEERHRLLKEGRRDGALLDLVIPHAKKSLDSDIWGARQFLKKHPNASAQDLIVYFTSLIPDADHIEAPLDRPGRYVISRGRNELHLWLEHAAQNRIDVEDIEETVSRLSLSPEALALVAADKDGELILGAAELRRRKKKLDTLRAKVEDPSANESDLQKILMGQPWIFGGQYVGEAAHRRLTQGDEVDIPLIRGDGTLHIVELKRAMSSPKLVKSHRGDHVLTAPVNDAIGQAQNYLVRIDEEYEAIRNQFGLQTRRSSATVLMGHPGCQPEITEEKINETIRKRNTVTSRVELLTYKELIDNAERALGLYRPPS